MAKVRSTAAKAKKHFLRSPYGAYYDRRAPREDPAPGGRLPKEDSELTHVGPRTPCGEYLRRYWQPIALSKDVQELPKAVKILDEELVVYRDKRGTVGCLELHCSHRGTSLEFGVTQERGIRCCYHGWLFDADGTILDTPTEAADSRLKEKLFHPAYPVHEHNGLIFVYMGPPDKNRRFRSSTPTRCPATTWLRESPMSSPATGCSSRKTLLIRSTFRSFTSGSRGITSPDIDSTTLRCRSSTGWRRRSA